MQKINLKLEVFEGPFDLLYHLIEKNELNIYDIPIASLTDQYILYIKKFSSESMDSMSEFLVMATTLLEIKSKMLLPKLQKESEEDEQDPRSILVAQLIQYKHFKKLANLLSEMDFVTDKIFFKKEETNLVEFLVGEKKVDLNELLSGVTEKSLFELFEDVLRRRELKVDTVRSSFSSIAKDNYTISEQIIYIENLLKKSGEITFSKIFNKNSTKIEKVVTFLALLEMLKIKTIRIIQNNTFDEIYCFKTL